MGFGVVVLVVSGWTGAKVVRAWRGERSPGVVVGVNKRWEAVANWKAWYPVVRFETADGRSVTAESVLSTTWLAAVHQGQRVDVFYEPGNPERAVPAPVLRAQAVQVAMGVVVAVAAGVVGLVGLGG